MTEHRSPYWCFTIHEEEKPDIETKDISYLVYQQEECPTTKKKHWQGYVEFKNRKRFNQVKDILGEKAHIEPRRGNSQQASDYCKKTETAIAGTQHEEGTLSIPAQCGLDAIKVMIDKGAKIEQVAEEHFGQYLRYNKNIRDYISLKFKQEIPAGFAKVKVTVYWGKPGTGKTRRVEEYATLCQQALYRMDFGERERVWWDGYKGERWLLMDDFEGQMDRTRFLKLTGGYGHLQMWPVKGGMTNIYLTHIFITSNKNPDDWYPWLDDYRKGAVKRRLTEVLEFK